MNLGKKYENIWPIVFLIFFIIIFIIVMDIMFFNLELYTTLVSILPFLVMTIIVLLLIIFEIYTILLSIIPKLLMLILGGYLIYKAIKSFTKLRKFKNVTTSKIRNVAMKLTEIKGKIIIKEPLYSPINNVKCAGYLVNYRIERKTPLSSGFSSINYKKNDFKTNDFYIEDETGKILVKAQGNEIKGYLIHPFSENKCYFFIESNGIKYNPNDNPFEFTSLKKIDPRTIKELLTLKNFSKNYQPVLNIICIEEETFKDGDEIYILGNIELNENNEKVICKGKDNFFIMSSISQLKRVWVLKIKSILYTTVGIVALSIAIIGITHTQV